MSAKRGPVLEADRPLLRRKEIGIKNQIFLEKT